MKASEKVRDVCEKLAGFGWRDLLLSVTDNVLDIHQDDADKLLAALRQPLTKIDRTKPGFEDFHRAGAHGIAAGSPARSLLYHALASPNVHPGGDGKLAAPEAYATLEDLDAVENLVYALAADRTDLDGTIVAVFAYQYREASRTTHLRHADMVYSRTGVARVGTTKPHYDPSRRSFWVVPADGEDGLAALPARYGVFLARRAKAGAAGTVQASPEVAGTFVFPVHKLFDGDECVAGRHLAIAFEELHRNEKLHRTHRLSRADGGLPIPSGFRIAEHPYVRDSDNGGGLVELRTVGATTLVVPAGTGPIVRLADQLIGGKRRVVHFVVPKARRVRDRDTRWEGSPSTLEIPAFDEDRLAPEYVNIRFEVDPAKDATQKPRDLNRLPPVELEPMLQQGGYPAAHFVDDTCDGAVEAIVAGLADEGESLPAFSLVTAPDYFPLADQVEVDQDPTIHRVEPLCRNRLPVNPTLPRPSDRNLLAFGRTDKTITAVVGAVASGPVQTVLGHPNRAVSFLPDAASNVFAPGWDTSRSRDEHGPYLTSSGLGSPFPEDAKLCAALASFWPAVAPDNGRTFGNDGFDNQLPMLDEELGLHPDHARVRAGERSRHGWDGEFGPFFETVDGKETVNYVAIERSDYVAHALAGRIDITLTAEVQSEELIARHQAFSAARRLLRTTESRRCLVVVRKIGDWENEANPGSPELRGSGYVFEFAELTGERKPTAELARVREDVIRKHVCHVGTTGIAYRRGDKAFEFHPG